MPKVSIIVPSYNGAKYLNATIDSIRAQTFTGWEAIIVNDSSTDRSLAIADAYAASDPRIKVVTQPNAGPSRARNRGFDLIHPSSRYIVFLDQDDTWEKGTLDILTEALDSDDQHVAAYGLARYIDSEGEFIERGVLEEHQRTRYAVKGDRVVPIDLTEPTTFEVEAVFEQIITCGTMLIRREAFKLSGMWDETLNMWEDWHLWLRLTRLGPIRFMDRYVLRYRKHDESLSADGKVREEGERNVRRLFIQSLAGDPELQRIAQIGAEFHQKMLIKQRVGWATESIRQGKILGAMKQLRQAVVTALVSD